MISASIPIIWCSTSILQLNPDKTGTMCGTVPRGAFIGEGQLCRTMLNRQEEYISDTDNLEYTSNFLRLAV